MTRLKDTLKDLPLSEIHQKPKNFWLSVGIEKRYATALRKISETKLMEEKIADMQKMANIKDFDRLDVDYFQNEVGFTRTHARKLQKAAERIKRALYVTDEITELKKLDVDYEKK